MELIFLNRQDLRVVDHAFVCDEFELVIDSVINQKSYFICNKKDVVSKVGDLLYLKDEKHNYIGVIDTIELVDNFKTKIQSSDFLSLFDSKVKVRSYNGDVSLYVKELIDNNFINSNDYLQNMNYLIIDKYIATNGQLNYDEDTLLSVKELLETLTKTIGIRLDKSIIIENGVISKIKIDILNITKGLIIRSDISAISNLVIADSTSQINNKVIYYPKSENISHKSINSFYLLTDGTITSNANSNNRYPYVKSISEMYGDNDFSNLFTKTQDKLLHSNLEHNITFKIKTTNKTIQPLVNFNVGDFVEFISGNKKYSTMVTQIKFKNNFNECEVVLGEYRIKLTDKIKLLEKRGR